MSPPAAGDAQAHCARIRDLILHHSGGWADADALRMFRLLSSAAARGAEDAECAELMRTANEYASDLFSASAHNKWAQGSTSGVDVLRLSILGKLDAFQDRLTQLLAARRGPAGPDAERMIYPSDE